MVLAFNQLQIYESQKYVFYLNHLVFKNSYIRES